MVKKTKKKQQSHAFSFSSFGNRTILTFLSFFLLRLNNFSDYFYFLFCTSELIFKELQRTCIKLLFNTKQMILKNGAT